MHYSYIIYCNILLEIPGTLYYIIINAPMLCICKGIYCYSRRYNVVKREKLRFIYIYIYVL